MSAEAPTPYELGANTPTPTVAPQNREDLSHDMTQKRSSRRITGGLAVATLATAISGAPVLATNNTDSSALPNGGINLRMDTPRIDSSSVTLSFDQEASPSPAPTAEPSFDPLASPEPTPDPNCLPGVIPAAQDGQEANVGDTVVETSPAPPAPSAAPNGSFAPETSPLPDPITGVVEPTPAPVLCGPDGLPLPTATPTVSPYPTASNTPIPTASPEAIKTPEPMPDFDLKAYLTQLINQPDEFDIDHPEKGGIRPVKIMDIKDAIFGIEGDPNNIGMQDFTGLNILDFEFSPHVPDMVSYESVEKYSKTTPNKIYSVDDYAAVLVQDNKVSIIGDGKYKIYNENPHKLAKAIL